MLEENTSHGSSLVQELVAATLEDIMALSRAKGLPAPHTICIVGDNTVKELKNSFSLCTMANLVSHGKIRSVGAFSQTAGSSL